MWASSRRSSRGTSCSRSSTSAGADTPHPYGYIGQITGRTSLAARIRSETSRFSIWIALVTGPVPGRCRRGLWFLRRRGERSLLIVQLDQVLEEREVGIVTVKPPAGTAVVDEGVRLCRL